MDLRVSELQPGSIFSIVAWVVNTEQGMLLCTGVSPHQVFSVSGANGVSEGLNTLYDVVKAEGNCCSVGEGTEIHAHPPKDPFATITLLDFCSGMGGFSIGSSILGIQTAAFVERSPLACDALRSNFRSPVIQADLGDVNTLKRIHPLKGTGHVQATGGFPCQGFSRQGDQYGMDDHRSHSLHYILQSSWLLQVDEILLECVANVVNFPSALQCIDDFAALANMKVTKLNFDLQDQWPVRRNRFWCRLSHKDLPHIDIPRWPVTHDFQTLADIMPLDALWDELVEKQLEWDPSELALYLDPSFGNDERLLCAQSKAPTVLHSWGHVNRPCPCGCRAAFNLARLRSGGARGFGLLSARSGCYRHLHAEEGAMLCTVPPSFHFPMPPRAALSLLGQIAAPLQVLWVQTHILASLQLHYWGWTALEPLQAIKILQNELRHYSFTRWITPKMYQPRDIQLQLVQEEVTHVIQITEPTTVGQLIQAENALCGWGHYVIVTCQGYRMHPEVQLLPGVTYEIKICVSRQVKPCPFQTPLLGGGSAQQHLQLGDRLIWDFMKEISWARDAEEFPQEPFLLPPFKLTHFLRLDLPPAVQQDWIQRSSCGQGPIFMIGELHGHWILLHGLWNSQHDGLEWTLYDGLRMGQSWPWAYYTAQKMSKALQVGFSGMTPGVGLCQRHAFTCGSIALIHMAQLLHLLHDVSDDQLQNIHFWLLEQQQWHPSELFAGGAEDTQQQLAKLLSEKGVPLAASSDRAKMITGRLGLKQVQAILKARNPWSDLKSAASKPGSMFRLITQDEQKLYIAERAKTKHGAKIANHKAKKQHKGAHPSQPVCLEPSQFDLDANHFKDGDDLPVPQIRYEEVESEARGVALCTTEQARHFLDKPDTISTDALALLLLDKPDDDAVQKAQLQPIIIPARFKGTDEHTLIYGHILQLGDNHVSRELASQDSNPDLVETQVVKFQVFRDQLNGDWTSFAQAPIRALVSMMDSLQLCKGSKCGAACGKYHPGLDETVENVIFEIWARSFFDANGRKSPQDQASLFTVFLRIPEGALGKLLTNTPVGVYAEPRGSKPREQDDRYRVVWLPGASAEEAAHQCRTYDRAICLTRLRFKYGIRVKKEDEQAAWSHLRPGTDFVAMNLQHIYELFPVPHGTQRHAIVKLLSDWKWTARPLQPGRGNYHHMSWRVGSQDPPPLPVMTGFQNDIVITQVKELKQPEHEQTFIASTKAQRQIRAAPAHPMTPPAMTDPWLERKEDPWARYGTKSAPSSLADGKSKLTAIQEQLRSDISNDMAQSMQTQAKEAVQAAAASLQSGAGQQETRIKALEVGLNELKGQNAQFSTWFQQAGERLQATESTMGAMQQTLNTHQNELHVLGSTFQSTMKTVKDDLSSEMNDSFNKQLSRLEALLEKKQRQA